MNDEISIGERGTATTSGLAKTLKHFGLDTRTPGLQREDRRAELQRRLGEFERARRLPPPPLSSLTEKKPSKVAGPKIPPPPTISRKPSAVGRPSIPPPPQEHIQRGFENKTEEPIHKAHDMLVQLDKIETNKRQQPRVIPESKMPEVPSFKCDTCGLHFKKIAHLIVHSRTHKRTAVTEQKKSEKDKIRISAQELKPSHGRDGYSDSSDDESDIEDESKLDPSSLLADEDGDVEGLVDNLSIGNNPQKEEKRDEAWIAEFARELIEIARREQKLEEPMPRPVLQKMKTAPARALAPPPRGTPPPHIQRTKSAFAVLNTSETETLRREIDELDRKRVSRIRSRLHDNKDVEIQEAEWELQRVQAELRRVEQHKGMFIDSRYASPNGHMQRWAKEDLLPKLDALERELNLRLEQEISRVRAEEDSHPQYGLQAQNERRFKLHQLQAGSSTGKKVQSLSTNRSLTEYSKSTSQDANELGREALSLHMSRKDPKRAEILYRRAIELDERHATNLGNFALFLQQWGSDHVGTGLRDRTHNDGDEEYRKECDHKADKYYRLAISADPSHTTNLANYAAFLKKNLRQHDRAEQYFERAIQVAPANASILGNYAMFLFRVRKDFLRADRMFQRALEIDPDHVNNCCNYATLLKKGFSKHAEAKTYYQRALRNEPDNPTVLCNFANMLVKSVAPEDDAPEAHAQIQKARDLYLRALRINPMHRMAKRNYMIFLRDFPSVRNAANERKLGPAPPPPVNTRHGRSKSPMSPKSPLSPGSGRRRHKRSRSPPGVRRIMSPTLETLIE